MDANINNEENHHYQHAAADARRRRRLELITVLQKTEEFPFQSKNKTDELVETFLENLKDDIHDMICSSGLDSDRDTETEVETVLRLFPDVLTRRKEIVIYIDHDNDDDDEEEEEEEEIRFLVYPIQFLAVTHDEEIPWIFWRCNAKAVSFLPLVARLAIEIGVFDEQQSRGGLLFDGEDHPGFRILHNLMRSDQRRSQEHHEYIDDKYLQVLIQLRKMGLLKKEDIQMYRLILKGLSCYYFYSVEKRFRFFVEWDPSALTQATEYGYLPVHWITLNTSRSPIRGFQSVFEYGIHYFPKKKGINLLFRKNNFGGTPFQSACGTYGHEQVMEVVEDTLVRYSTSLDNHAPPLNICLFLDPERT
ncbi:hypothetical protein FRACYDRAFT_243850 [Fragilariopsis cylindrus CCMP1102]|uniref:Uncharacterized protein n=1 Tax=Fragilariopsis cylindrus CCMP1102 TaxID=635003 RepID=A0A1E7F381_9STRA|nr:hypothetical protein FRACYDRAFT_243850 [Fragilariopsis cylindrus CCMP1102]|eukprot:OEU12597.1 hypothetical protein FRACYDRAFT_243850 [Fragilariopsis cylindrus CCMP1102]